MKKALYFAGILLFGAAFTACQDDYENVGSESNKLFNPSTEDVSAVLLDGNKVDVVTRSLSLTMAMPVGYEVSATYGADANYVKEYNNIYNQQAVMLPEENYEFVEPTVTIEPNKMVSSQAEIKFTGLASLDLDMVYVLPVRVVNSTIPVLASRDVTYYVFRAAALINCVGGLKETCLTFVNEGQTPALSGLSQFTFEALIYPDAFGRQISTLMGIEGNSLIRIGDAGVPDNQIQFAKGSNATDGAWQLEVGKWQFVTITYDGSDGSVEVYINGIKKGNTQTCSRGAINWNVASKDRACYIGYSYDTDRYFDGKISQVRVWNRKLSSAEINERNHFYKVENDADGLCLYLKFDENGGNLVHDYANGYDMQVPATFPGKSKKPENLGWFEVTLP